MLPILRVLYSVNLLKNGIDDLAKTIGLIIEARMKNTIQRNDILDNLLYKKVLGKWTFHLNETNIVCVVDLLIIIRAKCKMIES